MKLRQVEWFCQTEIFVRSGPIRTHGMPTGLDMCGESEDVLRYMLGEDTCVSCLFAVGNGTRRRKTRMGWAVRS